MSDIRLDEVNNIIEYVEFPCKKPEDLMHSLNIFIGQYEQIKDSSQLDKRTQKKNLEHDQQKLSEWYDQSGVNLLSSYSMIEHERVNLIKKGLSEQQLDTALLVLLISLETEEQKKILAIEAIERSKNLISEKPQPKFKNLLLCGILPKIYEEYFDKDFGISQSGMTKKNGGPGIRFIKAVSEHMNIGMSESAIAQSYKRLKA